MQGPVADILLLLLLILFFGFQQRERPQLHYRFWFVAWMMLLGSYMVWEVAAPADHAFLFKSAMRNDLLLVSGLAFALSFQTTREILRPVLRLATLVIVPACVAVDLQLFHALPLRSLQIAVLLLVFVGHAAAFAIIRLSVTPQQKLLRRFLLGVCAAMALYMAVQIARVPAWEVRSAVLFELFFLSAACYTAIYGLRSLAGLLGAVGFAAWAFFYPLADLLDPHPAALHHLFALWNLPKYLVGFSMIIRIFEEDTAEKDRLAEQFHSLYDDFRIVYQHHPHPMWIITAAESRFIAANDVALTTYGYFDTQGEILRLEDIELPVDPESAHLARIVPLPAGSRRSRLRCKNGEVLWVNLYDQPITFQGQPARLIMARDVSDFMAFNSAMAHRAFHDELTGLPNRALLADRLQVAIAAIGRQEGHLAIMAIDVDHFKRINDTYGHAVGDICLKLVAERLRSRIRQADTVARIGGEEFIAVVAGLRSKETTLKVALELLHAFDTPLELPDLSLRITISIGVALCPDHGRDPELLHRLADQALYRAKRDGRNCIRFVEPKEPPPPRRAPTPALPASDSALMT